MNIENSNNETNNNNNNNIELNLKEKPKSRDISEKIINNLLIGYDESNDNSDILKKRKLFAHKKAYTYNDIKLKLNNVLHKKKRASIINFRKDKFNSLQTPTIRNINEDKKSNYYLENDNIYFEDDILIPESSSFPNEYEEDFLLKLQFIEDNDFNDNMEDYNIRNCSFSYKKNQKDHIHLKYFNNSKNEKNDKNDIKINKFDNSYFDEKEEIGKNINYIDIIKNNDNKINIKNDNKEQNLILEYISINLLIKKVTQENFRNIHSIIYKCFLEQFKYFIPINILVNKIFSAFDYYYNNLKIDTSELILFLNTLIFENFDIIKNDKTTLGQLQKFYKEIKEIKWDKNAINNDLKSIDYLIFNSIPSNNEIINSIQNIEINTEQNFPPLYEFKAKNLISKKKLSINEKSIKYFNILNFKKEQIAQYLTCESYQLLSDIPQSELYNNNFTHKKQDKNAPHIKKIFDRYDKLICFIIEDICSYDNISDRVDVIEKWIRIAFVCLELKNFSDLIMIDTLFCNYLFKKMKITWNKLSKKSLNYLNRLSKICSGEHCYLNIRKEIFKAKGPFVPYIGILLKEITYIEESKYILENNNINIEKMVKLDKAINKFFEFKKYKYSFDKCKNLEILSNLNPKSLDEIEGIIQKIEPKLEIHAKKGYKKRLTQSDELFYKHN